MLRIKNYRPEIDGLRTIAVLSVILYHAQIVVFGHNFFKGGFVGVDIFFVISGYLISRILLSELFEKGKVNFMQFYERRARRILPILFTVFLVTFPFAYKYLLPNQFIEYAQSILSATLFGSNIFFYFTNAQYGAESSLLQPFLHTWSLGVEEQFYILFPILLLLAYKFAKNHLVTIITVLILISLSYADWQSTKNTQLNFFMLTSRLWELSIGSLLAFYELKYGRVKLELLNQTMPLLGLVLIMHSIVFFNNQTPHPSFVSLLPTLGTALIILYSVNKTDLVGKALSFKPIVGIGLISYSMYLWHYPIFAFARIADTNELHNDEKYLLILATGILSVISYFLIEKPFRNVGFIGIKKFAWVILILLITVILMSAMVIQRDGFKDRNLSYRLLTTEHPWNILKKDGKRCHSRQSDFCLFGNNKRTIHLIGDSHIGALSYEIYKSMHLKYNINIMTGCWPIKDVSFITNFAPSSNCTKEFIELVHKNILSTPNSIIIVGGRLPLMLSGKYFDNKEGGDENWGKDHKDWGEIIPLLNKTVKENIIRGIKSFLDVGHQVILVYPIPEAGFNVPIEISKIKKKNIIPETLSTSYRVYQDRTRDSFKLLDSIKHKNIYRVFPQQIFCDGIVSNRCYTHRYGDSYYQDTHHPSTTGATLINGLLIKEIESIEATDSKGKE